MHSVCTARTVHFVLYSMSVNRKCQCQWHQAHNGSHWWRRRSVYWLVLKMWWTKSFNRQNEKALCYSFTSLAGLKWSTSLWWRPQWKHINCLLRCSPDSAGASDWVKVTKGGIMCHAGTVSTSLFGAVVQSSPHAAELCTHTYQVVQLLGSTQPVGTWTLR